MGDLNSNARYGQTYKMNEQSSNINVFAFSIFFILHIPLAIMIQNSELVSTFHAYFTLALGLFFLLFDLNPKRLVLVAAYIVGAELLWRGTGADVFYEFGKYAIGLLLGFGLLRYHKLFRADKKPVIFGLLLLPSIFAMSEFDRELLAFNLLGPIILAIAATFFSTERYTPLFLQKIFLCMLAPIVGLAFLSFLSTLSANSLQFYVSTRATAAGIGPNQVSSILGCGVLISFIILILNKRNRWLQFLMGVILVWLVVQSALTFSRGGFWTAIFSILVGALYIFRSHRSRMKFLIFATFSSIFAYLWLFPFLSDVTGGLLFQRFTDFSTTGRFDLILIDLDAFWDNLLFGLGPGQSPEYHALHFRYASVHTEYSRLIAEHGLFGLFALILLLWMSIKRFFQRSLFAYTFLIVSLTLWALLFMGHSATRLVAPAFIFGMAAVSIIEEKDSHSENKEQI